MRITETIRVAGALVDADGVTLADRTSAYGVRRADTGDVVVPAGTAMARQSTGVYAYDFAADPTVPYEYALTVTYQGATQYAGPIQYTPPAIAAPPSSLLSTIADAATSPARASGDGWSADAHPLPDLIEADKYLAGKAAASKGPMAGVRRVRNVPPGAAGLDYDPYFPGGWRWRT